MPTEPTSLFAALIMGFGVLRDVGFKTFGAWSDGEVTSKARVFVVVLEEDPRITPEIVEQTVTRYITGKVTVWHRGDNVPAPEEFPSASAFRDACLETWNTLYKQVPDGEITLGDGSKVLQTKYVSRNTGHRQAQSALDAPATPEQIEAVKARISQLPARSMVEPSRPSFVSKRSPRPINPEAEAVLQQMAEIRRQHEGAA